MITVHRSADRGSTKTSWLDSRHSFSFGDYYNPVQMGFGALRVINEDVIAPGTGFGKHPHQNMEIITYVMEGELEHKDSLGNGSRIRPGEVQRMSAGTGILHSEFNASVSTPVHLLQIWILPATHGIAPGYEQKSFAARRGAGTFVLLASQHGENGGVRLHQDASLYLLELQPGQKTAYAPKPGRMIWVQVARGGLRLNGQALQPGDGAAITSEAELRLESAQNPAEILIFDLPETSQTAQ